MNAWMYVRKNSRKCGPIDGLMHTFICIYVCMYVYHVCMCISVRVYMCVLLRVHICVFMCLFICVYIFAHMCGEKKDVLIYANKYFTYIHTCVHTYIHTYIHSELTNKQIWWL